MHQSYDPNCTACEGTGSDILFSSPCTECGPTMVGRKLVVAIGANSASAQPHGPVSGGQFITNRPVERPTDKQLWFIQKLQQELGDEINVEHITSKKLAQVAIDKLLGRKSIAELEARSQPEPVPTSEPERKPNRFGGNCHLCGQWVEAAEGFLAGQPGAWKVEHTSCPERPPASPQRPYVTSEQVPAGYYALDTEPMKFYRLDYGKPGTQWAGSLFVTAIGGPDEYRIRNREARNEIIAAIAADPQEAMLRYGLNIGRCGHCNRRLTDEQSRLDGIGPICKAKMGW